MAITPTVIKGERREEFGKGSARRLRRDGKIPGVLYEKGIENIHFAVDLIEMTAIVRNDGANAIVELELDGEKLMAMVKHIDQNVITLDIDHIDLFGIKRGEKVTVEVPVVMEGEAAPGAVVLQETDYVEIEIDALSIPDELTVSIEGKEIGDALYATDVKLPEGAELISDAETLIVNVTYEQVDEDLEAEAEAAEEGGAEAGAESDAPAEEKGEE
ncbi:50S ribosomal protein L25 [Corynebacterium afermentans subsp. afermentans]|uniref:Large ribosomal subunit protein bL25 n=1 Tax=Corynebacterium afermentans TaxID=38286 RepID=A0A9X8R3K6_9CORY|nr:50S ribosomal protein L25/general stress protein Ctc [Corynebacterium afermentans]OAA16449.1 50S ribosomal protein L25/general stress protein Ctc [Corynebacterium afermentans subsp. afermentans]WJY56346.1 50S ribosomal protein L25 [Corynebacterium afermentans subsp. afermentans]SIQ24417.1 large subunit ribosomal protein L25 [Corynebacterium afermentans]